LKLLIFFLASTSLIFSQDVQTEIVKGNIFSAERQTVVQADKLDESQKRNELKSLHAKESQSLYIRTLMEVAEASGININSATPRKQMMVNGDETLTVERIYFGYDANIEEFTTFFKELSERFEAFQIQHLNTSVRRQPRNHRKVPERNALNGNCVIAIPTLDVDINRLIEQEPGYNEKDNVTALLYRLTLALPQNTYLTSLIIKERHQVRLMGFTEDVEELGRTLRTNKGFPNLVTSGAITIRRDQNCQDRFSCRFSL